MGLAAASTAQRLFRTVVIPAFAIEIVCCSIACELPPQENATS